MRAVSAHPQERVEKASADRVRRGLRILLADDNRDMVVTLATLLREDGHDVRGVHNGLDALRVARVHSFDAVILDIEMPELSGYAIAQELRKQYFAMRPPLLIAISGKWNRPSEKLLSRAVGFDHHFAKPYDPRELLELLWARAALPLDPN